MSHGHVWHEIKGVSLPMPRMSHIIHPSINIADQTRTHHSLCYSVGGEGEVENVPFQPRATIGIIIDHRQGSPQTHRAEPEGTDQDNDNTTAALSKATTTSATTPSVHVIT